MQPLVANSYRGVSLGCNGWFQPLSLGWVYIATPNINPYISKNKSTLQPQISASNCNTDSIAARVSRPLPLGLVYYATLTCNPLPSGAWYDLFFWAPLLTLEELNLCITYMLYIIFYMLHICVTFLSYQYICIPGNIYIYIWNIPPEQRTYYEYPQTNAGVCSSSTHTKTVGKVRQRTQTHENTHTKNWLFPANKKRALREYLIS